MGGSSDGYGFESQHCDIFVVKIEMFVWKDENQAEWSLCLKKIRPG